jgi:uncharacterized OsmC-like protein
MNAEQLRQMQAPVKEQYRADPSAAKKVLRVIGTLNPDRLTCSMPTWAGPLEAGLHPAAGGDGSMACSGDMLLESLVACAGVTLSAVATALGIQLRGGTVTAEGDLDFRGTLGVSKDVEIGFNTIRLKFDIDTDATGEQVQTLLKLTERYCVIYQTLRKPPALSHTVAVFKHG